MPREFLGCTVGEKKKEKEKERKESTQPARGHSKDRRQSLEVKRRYKYG